MASAPCKNCNEREVGCHSTCERYVEFKKADKLEKDSIRDEKQRRYAVSDFRKVQVEKALRKRGKR